MRGGSGVLVGLTLFVVLCLGPPGGEGATCSVPSAQYPSLQAALDDPGCDPVELEAQSYLESVVVDRSVTVAGVSSTATVVEGQVRVVAGTVALNHLRVDTTSAALAGRLHQALLAETGARVSGLDLEVVHKALLFGDSFESANTAAWSSTQP